MYKIFDTYWLASYLSEMDKSPLKGITRNQCSEIEFGYDILRKQVATITDYSEWIPVEKDDQPAEYIDNVFLYEKKCIVNFKSVDLTVITATPPETLNTALWLDAITQFITIGLRLYHVMNRERLENEGHLIETPSSNYRIGILPKYLTIVIHRVPLPDPVTVPLGIPRTPDMFEKAMRPDDYERIYRKLAVYRILADTVQFLDSPNLTKFLLATEDIRLSPDNHGEMFPHFSVEFNTRRMTSQVSYHPVVGILQQTGRSELSLPVTTAANLWAALTAVLHVYYGTDYAVTHSPAKAAAIFSDPAVLRLMEDFDGETFPSEFSDVLAGFLGSYPIGGTLTKDIMAALVEACIRPSNSTLRFFVASLNNALNKMAEFLNDADTQMRTHPNQGLPAAYIALAHI